MRRVLLVVLLLAGMLAGCLDLEPNFDDVEDLFAAAGGESWCGTELNVTVAPFVGNCGDPTTDGRVVLGVGLGGQELRESIDAARDNLTEDGQLLLVPTDPDREFGWQLRSRDLDLLLEAQEDLGGVLLDTEAAIDAWLAG